MTIKQILEVLNKKIDEGFGCMKIGRMKNDTFCPVVGFSFTDNPNEAALVFRSMRRCYQIIIERITIIRIKKRMNSNQRLYTILFKRKNETFNKEASFLFCMKIHLYLSHK